MRRFGLLLKPLSIYLNKKTIYFACTFVTITLLKSNKKQNKSTSQFSHFKIFFHAKFSAFLTITFCVFIEILFYKCRE